MSGRPVISLADRFWEKVNIRGPNDCWPWRASKSNKGYGLFNALNRDGRRCSRKAHVVAWELANKKWFPKKKQGNHSCNNEGCCNPRHTYPGTPKQNSADMVMAGRSTVGSRNPQSKLSERNVKRIRRLAGKKSWHEISVLFGVSERVAQKAAKGTTWRHVS